MVSSKKTKPIIIVNDGLFNIIVTRDSGRSGAKNIFQFFNKKNKKFFRRKKISIYVLTPNFIQGLSSRTRKRYGKAF